MKYLDLKKKFKTNWGEKKKQLESSLRIAAWNTWEKYCYVDTNTNFRQHRGSSRMKVKDSKSFREEVKENRRGFTSDKELSCEKGIVYPYSSKYWFHKALYL